MYLADTCYIIDLVQGDEDAKQKALDLDDTQVQVAISSITVEEYLRGIYYLFSEDQQVLISKLFLAESDLARFNVIPFDYALAKLAGSIDADLTKKGNQIGFADVLIAATAINFDLILLTRNSKHFKKVSQLKIEEY